MVQLDSTTKHYNLMCKTHRQYMVLSVYFVLNNSNNHETTVWYYRSTIPVLYGEYHETHELIVSKFSALHHSTSKVVSV